jgi:hypothetical protein
MTELLLKEESYKIIGLCMDVHRQLGPGFQEAVYKDALEQELKEANIPFEREKGFRIPYKQIVLERRFFCRFYHIWSNHCRSESNIHDGKQFYPANLKLPESI